MLKITGVRVNLAGTPADKLKAYCSITIDGCFMVRGIKLIEGTNGMFLAMPCRTSKVGCPRCNYKNSARILYCGKCGQKTASSNERMTDKEGSDRADIAHPLNADCRKQILDEILAAFEEAKVAFDKALPQKI